MARSHWYSTVSIFAFVFLLINSAHAQLPRLPVRQIYLSHYPAQYLGAVWMDEDQFRAVVGYSNACTVAGPDSFVWKSGQLNGMRICFDRIPAVGGEEVIAVAVKSLYTTSLKILTLAPEPVETVVDSVRDLSYWEMEVRYRISNSITSIKNVGLENAHEGLILYSTLRDEESVEEGDNLAWRLTGDLRWKYLNGDGEDGSFQTGGITSLETLNLPGEEMPLIYYGVTYETGEYRPRQGGSASMSCEIVSFDLNSRSENAFYSVASERNEQGEAPKRVSVLALKAGFLTGYGPVIAAITGRETAEQLLLLDGETLELINSVALPPKEVAGIFANIVLPEHRPEGGADLLVFYKSGLAIAGQFTGDQLDTMWFTMGGPLISAITGNFDDDPEDELAATMDRRLAVFDMLSLAVIDPPVSLPVQMTIDCFPNPFNSTLLIRYATGEATLPRDLTIFDIEGRSLYFSAETLPMRASGVMTWNAKAMPAGVYFVRLQVGSESITQKVVLMR